MGRTTGFCIGIDADCGVDVCPISDSDLMPCMFRSWRRAFARLENFMLHTVQHGCEPGARRNDGEYMFTELSVSDWYSLPSSVLWK